MPVLRSSALVDTSVVYCGDNLEQLRHLTSAIIGFRRDQPARRVRQKHQAIPVNAGADCFQPAPVSRRTESD